MELHRCGRKFLPLAFIIVAMGPVVMGQGLPAPDGGGPPWGAFLPQGTPDMMGLVGDLGVDPLLMKPFRMAPAESASGLAAKIRARELDIPNRIAAIQYLSTLHCAQFPEAREMLVAVLMNDEWEPVRFEAVTALRNMFQNTGCPKPSSEDDSDCEFQNHVRKTHAVVQQQVKCVHKEVKAAVKPILECDPCAVFEATKAKAIALVEAVKPMGLVKCKWKEFLKPQATLERKRGTPDPPESGKGSGCVGCCDAATLNKLAQVAYKLKDDGSCLEPSRRVREMAVKAIQVCGIPCHYRPNLPETAPSAGSPEPVRSTEEPPPVVPEDDGVEPPPTAGGVLLYLPSNIRSTAVPTPITKLAKVCVVSFKQGRLAQPSDQFSSTYRGRIYYLADAAAQQDFEQNPAEYAVAFGGCDPVQFVATQEIVEGRYLLLHEGQLLMFVSKKNAATYQADVTRYMIGQSQDKKLHAVSIQQPVTETVQEETVPVL